MKIIKPYHEILTPINGVQMLKHIESCGRICYKSEHKITDDSYRAFVKNIIQKRHGAVLEHASISVKFVCDRGVSHEIVRHRLASYCQESTRYCNYAKDDFQTEITVIKPFFLQENTLGYRIWEQSCNGNRDDRRLTRMETFSDTENISIRTPTNAGNHHPAGRGTQI